MSTFKSYRLDELAEVVTGETPRSEHPDSWGDEVDFITPSDQSNGMRRVSCERKLSRVGAERHKRRIVPPGSTNLTCIGATIGKVSQAANFCLTNQQINSLVARPDVCDPDYLYYLIRDWSYRLKQDAVGSATPIVNKSTLASYSFVVPGLQTQHAIAEVLGALDDKIAANRHLSQVIDDLASSLFQKRFKHAPSAPLTSIAKVNTTSISPQSEGEFRYLDISLVGNGTSESPTLTTWAEAPSRARRGVPAGSTIWSTVRPNRRSHCLILDEDPILVASTGFAVLTPSECGPAFLYETTKQKSFQDYLESVAEGSAYPAVRSSEFAKAPVTSATKEERNAFEEEAGPLRALQASLERENQVLASTRDELLPLLMSGRITVGAASSRVEEVV